MSTASGPAPARDTIDLARGFRFVPEDPGWIKKVLIGGVFMFLVGLLVGAVFVAGYGLLVLIFERHQLRRAWHMLRTGTALYDVQKASG